MYNDITNFTGFAANNGGATSTVKFTDLVADDITPIAGAAGQDVTSFSFSVANSDTVAVSAEVEVRFFDTAASGGGPGNEFANITFNPISFAANNVSIFSFNPTAGSFVLPTSNGGAFWAGIAFTTTAPASAAVATQLNDLGQGIFSPPTVGSSTDDFFQSTGTPGNFSSGGPAGFQTNFGGNPAANFGWSFTTAAISAGTVAPESNTAILLGLGLAAAGGLLIARRRANA